MKQMVLPVTVATVTVMAQPQDFTYYVDASGLGIREYIGSGGSVTVPSTVNSQPVNSISSGAFWRSSGLTNITVDPLNSAFSSLDGVLFNKDQTALHAFPPGKTGNNYVVPNTVSVIGNLAFRAATGLTSVTLPSGVRVIGGDAFWGCTNLNSVVLPSSLTSIGGFAGCTALTNVTMGNAVTHIEGRAFEGCTALTSVSMPESVTSIGDEAFYGCTGLTSVSIPDNVIEIGQYAFYDCTGLTSLTIGKSVTFIGSVAFQGCTGLTRLTIPANVTGMGISAFQDCAGLTSVTIGSGLTSMINDSFSGCTGLKSVYFLGNAPFVRHDSWDDFPSPAFSESDRATVFYRTGTTGWAETFGGRPTLLWVSTDDLDQDGMNNQEEMVAGTDPVDASSLLAFERAPRPDALDEEDLAAVPDGQHAIYFQSIPGMGYRIASSQVLGINGQWTIVATVSATTFQKRVLVEKPVGAAFYQIAIEPPSAGMGL